MATPPMDSISVSQFKATCLAVLEKVRRTGRPILITKRGKPIAEVTPPTSAVQGACWIGSMRGTFEIVGDIESPIMPLEEWEAWTE